MGVAMRRFIMQRRAMEQVTADLMALGSPAALIILALIQQLVARRWLTEKRQRITAGR
jgi:uncharacterized membrane protein